MKTEPGLARVLPGRRTDAGQRTPRRRIGMFGAVGPNLLPTHADARPGPQPPAGPVYRAGADLEMGKGTWTLPPPR